MSFVSFQEVTEQIFFPARSPKSPRFFCSEIRYHVSYSCFTFILLLSCIHFLPILSQSFLLSLISLMFPLRFLPLNTSFLSFYFVSLFLFFSRFSFPSFLPPFSLLFVVEALDSSSSLKHFFFHCNIRLVISIFTLFPHSNENY